MNRQMQTQAQPERSTYSELALSETDLLAGWGFDPHEIVSLSLPLFSCLHMKKDSLCQAFLGPIWSKRKK